MLEAVFPHPTRIAAFMAASLVYALVPGPGVLYVVTRSFVAGPARGLASVAGLTLGNLVAVTATGLGVAALLESFPAALLGLRLAGACYLLLLGVQTLARRPAAGALDQVPAAPDARRLFRDGMVVALLNPKTLLFVSAFLPQFLAPGDSYTQVLALGLMLVCLGFCTDSSYALAAGFIGTRLSSGPGEAPWMRLASALVFFGLGLAALSGRL